MKRNLTITVGITTCFGDPSIVETITSIRKSKNVQDFPIILIADRIKISADIKKILKKLSVHLIENKTESSQMKKQKQILKLTKTDLLIFTQDDVLFDEYALSEVVKRFSLHKKTTMISILNKPLKPMTVFEGGLEVGTNLANSFAKYWNKGDNYLSVIGRFMAFRTDSIKNKYRMITEIATTDTYYYLENKRVGGGFEYMPEIAVYFRNPQNMKEHLRKSSRFQFSLLEMSLYFSNVSSEYKVSKIAILRSLIEQIVAHPIMSSLYFLIFLYTRLLKMKPKSVLNPVWEVDVSTKKLSKII